MLTINTTQCTVGQAGLGLHTRPSVRQTAWVSTLAFSQANLFLLASPLGLPSTAPASASDAFLCAEFHFVAS